MITHVVVEEPCVHCKGRGAEEEIVMGKPMPWTCSVCSGYKRTQRAITLEEFKKLFLSQLTS